MNKLVPVLASAFFVRTSAPTFAGTIDRRRLTPGRSGAGSAGIWLKRLACAAMTRSFNMGGLCWAPCVGTDAIRREIESRYSKRRIEDHRRVCVGSALVQPEDKIAFIDYTGGHHVIVGSIYEVFCDKTTVVRPVGRVRTPVRTALPKIRVREIAVDKRFGRAAI